MVVNKVGILGLSLSLENQDVESQMQLRRARRRAAVLREQKRSVIENPENSELGAVEFSAALIAPPDDSKGYIAVAEAKVPEPTVEEMVEVRVQLRVVGRKQVAE